MFYDTSKTRVHVSHPCVMVQGFESLRRLFDLLKVSRREPSDQLANFHLTLMIEKIYIARHGQ